jgi:hypothetical protein
LTLDAEILTMATAITVGITTTDIMKTLIEGNAWQKDSSAVQQPEQS